MNTWSFRNRIQNININPTEEALQNLIESSLKDIKNTCRSHQSVPTSRNHASQATWKPPKASQWKMNADAAWYEKEGRGGIGWVVRDSSGSLICFGMKSISKNWPIKMLEAEAIREGLRVVIGTCKERSIPLAVESDALEVINC